MQRIVCFVAAFFLCGGSITCRADVNEQFDATCRITAPIVKDGKSGLCYGTGCAIRATESYVAVMTNAHVVGNRTNTLVTCEFWSHGHQSGKLPGQVFVSDTTIDTAIVLVPTPAFGGLLPKTLKFARQSPQPGDTIVSVGCAGGQWQTGWKGHVTGYRDGMMWFVPPPADGRSGSAITNEAGEIVALLRVRMGDDSCGGAVDLATLRGRVCTAMQTESTRFQPLQEVAQYWVRCPGGCCPGGSCPGGSCPYQSPPTNEDGLFNPPLFSRLHQPPAPSNPWPTLPPAQNPPADLTPVIGAINSLQDTIRNQQPVYPPAAAPASPVMPLGPDPATVSTLQQHGAELSRIGSQVEELRNDVPRAIGAAVQPLVDQITTINKAIAPIEAIKAKLDSDIAAGGIRGKVAQQFENGLADPTDWIKHSLLALGVVIALGSVGLVVHAVHAHKAAVQAGQPDPLEKMIDDLKNRVQGAAAANPMLAPLAAGTTAADALLHKLLDQQTTMTSKMVDMALQVPTTTAAASASTATAPATPSSNVVNVHTPT